MSASSESSPPTSPTLDEFGRNLNAIVVREGQYVLGREREVERMMEALSRDTRNIPVLVGESGVGKRTVVRGLAQRIAKGEVPAPLAGKQLYTLDIEALAAESETHSPFEDLLRKILSEIVTRGNIILVLDDLPIFVSSDAPEAVVGGAAILRPMLIRGEIQTIGSTTPHGYNRYLKTDAALERRFQEIEVAEPSLSVTIEILKALRDRYEGRHRVSITDDALVAAALLADRFISDGFLPTKAIDLIDQAGSRMRIRLMNAPPDLLEFDEMIADARRNKESAIDSQDFEKAAGLRDKEKQLIEKKDLREKEWKAGDMTAVAEVNEELITEIVATATGIPVSELRKPIDAAYLPYDEARLSAARYSDKLERAEAFTLLNDQPLDKPDNDLIGSAKVAGSIASILNVSRTATPLVVAIDAGWGMGKSTLLRQIESQLPGRPSVIPVRFNAWTAQGENALEGLIKSVLVELDRRIVRRWARKVGRQRNLMLFGRIGFSIVGRFFGLTRLVDELWSRLEVDAKARNDLRDMIHNMLSDWVNASNRDPDRTLVVFIDDLDRCSDDVIVKVCEAVKLYLDAPGLIFVIACDLSVLARGVSTSAPDSTNQGRRYLEKIVQVAYRLPPPEEAQIRQLVRGYMVQSGTTELIDDSIVEILVTLADRNPRRIKRIINGLIVEYRLNPAWLRAPLGSGLLVRAVVLQHLYTPFYDLLVADKSGEDPIGDFLDYADVCARAADPPAGGHAWWSIASRTFQRRGMPAPERPSTSDKLMADLKQLEGGITWELQVLARDASFITLLRGMGSKESRQALRAQLITRPRGDDVNLDEF
jgi:hypothetical protein